MNKKSFRLPIVLVLAIALGVSVFSGCSSKETPGEKEPVVEVLSLNTYELTAKQFTETELRAYLPQSLKGKEVSWSSSDVRKVTVAPSASDSRKAIVTAVGITNSPVKITATCANENVVCKVAVVKGDDKRSIYITADGEAITNETLTVGSTLKLTGALKDNDKIINDVAIAFSSSDPSRVSVTPSGLVIAVSRGNGVVISATANYKGQEVSGRVIVTVKDETKDAAIFDFMKEAENTRKSSITNYSGDVTALGFKVGDKVKVYNGVTSDFGLNPTRATNAIFDSKIVTESDDGKLVSKYDKLVFDCSFTTRDLPFMNFWLGGAAISIQFPALAGRTAIAFYNAKNIQANTIAINTVYTCVVDLTQMKKDGRVADFGFAFVSDVKNKTPSGNMYIANAVACTDYVFVNEYAFPTPSGKITMGAYTCFAEVGGYATIPSTSDIPKETTGAYAGWGKVDYQRSCPVTINNHTHNADLPANPICNRVMPMLPTIGKASQSLGAGGYWNYDDWGFNFVLGAKPTGAYLNAPTDIPEAGKGYVMVFRSGRRDIGITEDGYIGTLNSKLDGKYEEGEFAITNADGESLIKFDAAKKLYKVDLQINTIYTICFKTMKKHDSFGFGVYSATSGNWYVNNPFFEKL